ncbi:HAD family hydrolase [Pseudoalteromonas sp. SSDWG2]|uniref:HAD family hydrolase n=1 Tax=Pseudoalteromonas sp. SSDWG2 TaxID=3139391 RepID=UPI003BAB6C23
MINTLLFDFDGTLVDSEVLHFQCWAQVLAPFAIELEEESFCRQYSGRPTLASAFDMVQKYALDADGKDLAAQKNALFTQIAVHVLPPLLPHVEQVLSQAHNDGFTLALVTGSTRDEVTPILEGYGFTHLFKTIVTKDDVHNPKPHPEPYRLALSRLGVQPYNALAIEDTYTGSRSAKDAALSVYVVPNKYTQEQDFTHVDGVFSDLKKMYATLTKP